MGTQESWLFLSDTQTAISSNTTLWFVGVHILTLKSASLATVVVRIFRTLSSKDIGILQLHTANQSSRGILVADLESIGQF